MERPERPTSLPLDQSNGHATGEQPFFSHGLIQESPLAKQKNGHCDADHPLEKGDQQIDIQSLCDSLAKAFQ